MAVQYVIKRGIDDRIDYNMDGVIDENDDIVLKLVDGVEVSRRPLNERTKQRIDQVMEEDKIRNAILETQGIRPDMQRMVYERTLTNVQNPPPVIIKNDTGFGQHLKAGAGDMAGRIAVMGIVSVIGGLFSDGGRKTKSKKK